MTCRGIFSAALIGLCLTLPVAAQEPAFADAMSAYRAGKPDEAAAIFLRHAKEKDPVSQFNLAVLYARGDGVPQNDKIALYWAWRAKFGGVDAAGPVIEYLNARLPEASINEVVGLLDKRLQDEIASGDTYAMMSLSRVYGEVIPEPDMQKALMWMIAAAAMGVKHADLLRDVMSRRVDEETRDKAQAEAIVTLAKWCETRQETVVLCRAGALSF